METIMLDVNVFALVDYIIKFNNECYEIRCQLDCY